MIYLDDRRYLIQTIESDYYVSGIFQPYFYKNLFSLKENSTILNDVNLMTIEKLLNELV